MALTASIALSNSTPGIGQSIIASVTISNSGASSVSVTAVTPVCTPISSALLSVPSLNPPVVTVPASGSAVVTYTAVLSAAGTYSLGALCTTSDGSNFSPSPASATVAMYSTAAPAFATLDSASAGTVMAGPISGPAATPSFRALGLSELTGSLAGTQLATGQAGEYARQMCVATYDFSISGGAIGTIALPTTSLPAGAIVTRVYLDVITQPTSSGSATVALTTGQVAADLMAATAIASLTVGQQDGKPDGTAAHMVKCTAARSISVAIATAALTAGKFYVFAEYAQSAAT